MNEPKSGSTAKKPLSALRFSDLQKGEEGPWQRIVLELLAVRMLQGREDIGFDDAIDKLGDELGVLFLLTHPSNEDLKRRGMDLVSAPYIAPQSALDFVIEHGHVREPYGLQYLPDWLVEGFVELAAEDEPVLFLNWSTSSLVPRFLLHWLQSDRGRLDFRTVDRDARVVEDLRLMLSLVVDDLDQVVDSVWPSENVLLRDHAAPRLNLFDTFETGKEPQDVCEFFRKEMEFGRFGTAFVNQSDTASYYSRIGRELPAELSEVLKADGRAVILAPSDILYSVAWSGFRENARSHLPVEAIIDFASLGKGPEGFEQVPPALVSLRQAQHSITRQATVFAPARPGDTSMEAGELLHDVVSFLNDGGQLQEAVAFEQPTSELIGRWEPKFYCPPRLELQDRLIRSPQATWLGAVARFIEGGVPPSVLVPYIRTRIAGVTFEGRQEALAYLKTGDKVWLRREPENPRDPNAVHVERRSGTSLGYLPAELAAEMAEALDVLDGRYAAIVTEIRGGNYDQPYGATIEFAPPEHASRGEAVKVIRPRDITNNQLTGSGEAAWLLHEVREKVIRLQAGDVLLLLRGFGKACVVPRELDGAVCHQDIAIVRPGEGVDSLYLLAFMVSAEFQEQLRYIARGEAVPIIDLRDLSEILVLLPPLPEQRRIALAFAESQGHLGPSSAESLGRWLEFASGEQRPDEAWVSSSLLSSLFSDFDRIDSLEDWLHLKGRGIQQLRSTVVHGTSSLTDVALQQVILGFAGFREIIERVEREPATWTAARADAKQTLATLRTNVFLLSDEGLKREALVVIGKLDELAESRTAPAKIFMALAPETVNAGVASRVAFSVENATTVPMEITQFQSYAPGAADDAEPEQILRPRVLLLPGEAFTFEQVVQIDRVGRVSIDCEVAYDLPDLPGGPYWEFATLGLEVLPSAYVPIQPNPYITGGAVDSPEMFFGRQDVLSFLKASLIGKHQSNVIVLQGNRRTGKSSILKQVVNRDLFAPHIPVFIDCQGLGQLTNQSFFYKLAREIWKGLAKRDDIVAPSVVKRQEISEQDPFYDFQDVLDRLVAALPGRRIILLLDEFEIIDMAIRRGELDGVVLENLRHLFQHRHDLAVVLTGSYRLMRLSQEYWSILFGLGLKREVGFLDEASARQLITQPLEGLVTYSDEAIERIIQLSGCQPYFLQMICHNLVIVLNALEQAHVTPSHVEDAAQETLISAEGHMRYVFDSVDSAALKAILVYMASSLAQPGTLSGHQIEAFAQEHGFSDFSAGLEEGLRQMADRDIVQIEGTMEQRRYGFKIDLLRQWIRRSHDLKSAIALAQDASYTREG